MKHRAIIIFIIILTLFLLGCGKVSTTEAEKSAIKEVLDNYIVSIEK
jgi:outer membrane lipoprotein-sorting protein